MIFFLHGASWHIKKIISFDILPSNFSQSKLFTLLQLVHAQAVEDCCRHRRALWECHSHPISSSLRFSTSSRSSRDDDDFGGAGKSELLSVLLLLLVALATEKWGTCWNCYKLAVCVWYMALLFMKCWPELWRVGMSSWHFIPYWKISHSHSWIIWLNFPALVQVSWVLCVEWHTIESTQN